MSFFSQLPKALQEVVDHYNGGSSATDSVVKVAAAHDFNPDQVQRLVEQFNTAISINHYKTAAVRSSEHTVVDTDEVLARLYPDVDKSAAVKTASHVDEDFYHAHRTRKLEKSASDFFTAKAEPVVMDKAAADRMEIRRIDDLRHTAEQLGVQALQLESVKAAALRELANDFRFYPEKAAEVIHGVILMRGEEAAPMIQELLKTAGMPLPDMSRYGAITDVNNTQSKAAAGVIALIDTDNAIKEARDQAELLEKAADAAWNTLCGAPAKADTTDISSWFATKKAQSEDDGLISFIPAVGVSKLTAGVPGPTSVGEHLKNFVNTMADSRGSSGSTHIARRLENQHRQLLLTELIATDPVLKGTDPHSISRAYESFANLAPEASLDRELTRSVLRSASQASAVSPYDAAQLVKLDIDIRRRNGDKIAPDGGAK